MIKIKNKKFKKIYIEITNICDLKCSFCNIDKRPKKHIEISKFQKYIQKTSKYTDYYTLYVKGEPLLHPELQKILDIAKQNNKKITLSTNGYNIQQKAKKITDYTAIYRINISLHSYMQQNPYKVNSEQYTKQIIEFIENASKNSYISLRIWRKQNQQTQQILKYLEQYYKIQIPIKNNEKDYYKIKDKIYINYDKEFQWPDITEQQQTEKGFCYGLRDHVAILNDGTVVPCCLDENGIINLGNLNEQEFSEIINSKRSKAIYDNFSQNIAIEELCKKCTYKNKFIKKHTKSGDYQ
ncbi:SPASM domain-containing protein [Oceanotoga sp. DSM 15011]|uniref:radical SAM/SPASM domain-containing protein n=1 Tax=Oceanotoga sp. DSM 15011 TaxID=2984951 RepID=UPI0021F41081|nr:radical SAM/SPASM domain-containing protein [Oceanotoga sp. DSM 15011]UYO99136.1 SPASM domain-containing protein [Oceanotoga sp. DSM 15011]